MTGTQLLTALQTQGATLHLDDDGTLHVAPPQVAAQYREAITTHLGFLLVTAAVRQVQALIDAMGLPQTAVKGWVSTALMDAACLGGDVAQTRQAAVTYVREWTQGLRGETYAEHL